MERKKNNYHKLQAIVNGESKEHLYHFLSSFDEFTATGLIARNNFECVHNTIQHGQSDMTAKFFIYLIKHTDLIPSQEALIPIKAGLDVSLPIALSRKYFDVIELIFDQEFLSSVCIEIIASNIDYIKIIWASKLKNIILYIFATACYHHLKDVEAILTAVAEKEHYLLLDMSMYSGLIIGDTTFVIKDPLDAAFSANQVNIFNLLWNKLDEPSKNAIVKNYFPIYFQNASKKSTAEAIKNLARLMNRDSLLHCIRENEYGSFIYAADAGSDESIKFLLDSIPTIEEKLQMVTAFNNAAYRFAKNKGHRKVLEILNLYQP